MSSYGNPMGGRTPTEGEKKVKVSERLEEGINVVSAHAGRAIAEGKEEARNVMGTLKKGVTDIKTELAPGVQKLTDTADNVGGFVKKNPGAAMLITFAVGMFVGAVSRFGRRNGA